MQNNNEIIENTEVKVKDKNKSYNKIIIVLIIVIALLAVSLVSIFAYKNISKRNTEKKYQTMLETLMDCYKNEDVEAYKELCYPEGFYQLEVDVYYDGDSASLDEEMKDSLTEELEGIQDEYGNQVDFSIDITETEDASSSDISSIKSQMNSWTEQLEADDIEIVGGERITFDLSIKCSEGLDKVEDCYAMIIELKDGTMLLWDWNFADADWDTYVYYSED